LRGNGFSVEAYNDPVEAVSAFKAGAYDLVLLDIRMPRMNGFQAYRELKKIDQVIRICFLTSFEVHESEFSKLFPVMGAHWFLQKPIAIRALMSKIDEMVLYEAGLTEDTAI
jgi:two-component system catabolic regulation response regulator CreB/two-component system response regulator ChvI